MLLGEAGIGKTTEVQRLLGQVGATPRYLDLGEFGSESALEPALSKSIGFEPTPCGCDTLLLVLDSLDEAMLEIPRITAVLKRALMQSDRSHVLLRVACRTAAWPETLGSMLDEMFEPHRVDYYELAPLRRTDVATAVVAEGLDADGFLAEVARLQAESLASNPVSLRFLLKLFAEKQALSFDTATLFERGLTILCEESRSRRDRGATSSFTAPQLVQVASRLAALTVFTKRSCIYLGSGVDKPDEDPDINEACGGQEGTAASGVEVTPAAIRAALASGLFSSRGRDRVGFAHRTYAEFLAARYLHTARVGAAHRRALLFTTAETPHRLIPQLYETAAWLASLDREFSDELLRSEPEVLLLSDIGARNDAEKSRLVERLIGYVARGDASTYACREWRLRWHRLSHAGLSEQLRPVIVDPWRELQVRLMAVDIAEACICRELAIELATISLNEGEPYEMRCAAARAVVHIGDAPSRERFKPLALGCAGDDPRDQLRGYGLEATWPDYLSFQELFQALTPPNRSNHLGSYQVFLSTAEIADRLTPRELPLALDWATTVHGAGFGETALRRLATKIACRAWWEMDSPAVLKRLATLTMQRLQNHECVFTEDITGAADLASTAMLMRRDPVRRRRLLLALIEHVTDSEAISFLLFGRERLVATEDFEWLLEQACAAPGHQSRVLAHLAKWTYDVNNPRHLDLWLDAKRRSATVAEVMNWPEQIELRSAEARDLQQQYQRTRAWQRRRTARRRPARLLKDQVRQLLDRCAAGEPGLFWALARAMALTPDGGDYDIPEDLKGTHGWTSANQQTQREIVEAARRFLRAAPPDPEDILARDDRYLSDLAPSLALRLIMEEDPAFLGQLPKTRWNELTPFILAAPLHGAWNAIPAGRRVAELAFDHAPDAAAKTALQLLQREKGGASAPTLVTLLANRYDARFGADVLGTLRAGGFSPVAFAATLGWLLFHGSTDARDFAQSIVDTRGTAGDQANLALEAAVQLVMNTPDAAWDVVWSAISSDSVWGATILERLAYDFHASDAGLPEKLSDGEIGSLVAWLFRHYPPATDPDHDGPHDVSPDESVRHFRDALLQHLQSCGTSAACAAIQRLRDAHPEYPWLRLMLLGAQRERRKQSWLAPSPGEVRRLLEHQDRRWVGSASQLLALVVESLGRLERELHGTTPARNDLWNQLDDGKWRPKDENHLSDYLARHLRRDLSDRGVVVNREVEIRRRTSPTGSPGEELDILVSGVLREPRGADEADLAVVLEVKGCWHKDVRACINSQLGDRYLRDNQCRYGLYLVGWFVCDAWDSSDPRKKATPWRTISDAREELGVSAEQVRRALAPEGDVRAFVLDCALR